MKKKRTWVLKADSKESFIDRLDKLPVRVGSRLKSRPQRLKEQYVLKRYYDLLARADGVRYPVRITKQESPDFYVNESSVCYGLEITESTFQAYQYFLTECAKRKWDMSPAFFRYQVNDNIEAVKRILNEGIASMRGHMWYGVAAERAASGWAYQSLKRKLKTVSKWGLPRNDLRICLYQNCPAWINDVPAFINFFQNRIVESVDAGETSLDNIKVDFLLGGGDVLVYDVLGHGLIIGPSVEASSFP